MVCKKITLKEYQKMNPKLSYRGKFISSKSKMGILLSKKGMSYKRGKDFKL